MIYQICEVMMSISAWDRVHLWIYLLNNNTHGIIQEFNLGVGSHMSISLSCEFCSGGGGGAKSPCCNPLYFAIYAILPYILFFKTLIFSQNLILIDTVASQLANYLLAIVLHF